MSISDRLFTDLRRDIIDGRYRPHQRLVESDLAEEFDASRTPIRQALQRLELEGLVSSSRHGWVIREHTEDDLLAMYDIRVALEGYASRLATERGTEEDLVALVESHTTLASMEAALASGAAQGVDRSEFVELHDQYHDRIVVTAGNPVLRTAIRSYREHPYNRRVAHNYTPAEIERAAFSHKRILDAITSRDASAAEISTREHLLLARDVTLDRVKRGM